MPSVKCPSCGERGKITAALLGARIKCKQCGTSFMVSPPAAKATAGLATGYPSSPAGAPDGIAVEGLDASAWTLSTEPAVALKVEATADPDNVPGPSSSFESDGTSSGVREYKVLTPRDKYFDGKFELARLEEALNHFAREGWTVKSMSTPHFKNFTGALEEVVVVLLER